MEQEGRRFSIPPGRMTKVPPAPGRKDAGHRCLGQRRGRDMRTSQKHVTHIGPEARSLSSKPLPPSPSLPPHPTQWHEVAQLAEAAIPVVSGAGRAAQRAAGAKGPSPGTVQGSILCPRLGGQEGSGRPESPRKRGSKRSRDEREEREGTENGSSCGETQRGCRVEAEPSPEGQESRTAGTRLSLPWSLRPPASCWPFSSAGGRWVEWCFGALRSFLQARPEPAHRRRGRRSPQGRGADRRLGDTGTHTQTPRARSCPEISVPLFLTPYAPVPSWRRGKSSSASNLCPWSCSLGDSGAARGLGGGAGVAHGSRAQRSRWGRSGGWRDGKAAEGGDSRLASPCQGPRAPGGGARVTRLWRGRLLRCCLPAGRESRGRCQGASPLQPGPRPAGLLGNQESQAQLIKLWAQAVQERSGVQDLRKPRGTAVPPRSPPSVQAPGGRTRPGGPLSPSWGSVASILSSPLPSHRSSASTRCSRPDPSTPSPTGGRAGMGVGDAR